MGECQPMHFVLVCLFWLCNAWEICLVFCKQTFTLQPCISKILSISAMHCIIKTNIQKAWVDVLPACELWNILKSCLLKGSPCENGGWSTWPVCCNKIMPFGNTYTILKGITGGPPCIINATHPKQHQSFISYTVYHQLIGWSLLCTKVK